MKKTMKLAVLLLAVLIGFSILGCNNEDAAKGKDDNGGGTSKVPVLPELPSSFSTAADLVSHMTIGWNLGNTLDAHNRSTMPNPSHSVQTMETMWVRHVTNQANINAMKAAGFNTIRIPVTWYKAIGGAPNYTIRPDWMARVKEIVDYVISAGDMFVILNTHHDEYIFKFTDAELEESLIIFRKIWEQIADTFKNYDERLIFEALNEPRDTTTGNTQWNGGGDGELANLNKYYPVFVDVVRKSGGYNDRRVLMINTHAASADLRQVDALVLPTDTVPNRLIASVHFYSPYNFALNTNAAFNTWTNSGSDRSEITSRVDRVHTKWVSKGTPVIIGEFGAMNKDNEQTRANWAEFYVSYARERGIKCVWWDNGSTTGTGELFGLLNRSTNTFHYPVLLDALVKAAGVQFEEQGK